MASTWRESAEEHFARGDYAACREAALERLRAEPDDLDALRLAGRAGVELAEPDAADQLRRVTELAPDDVAAWRDLGDALAADGRTAEAEHAWKRVVELRPDDSRGLTDLGHAALAAGDADAAAERLRRAAEAEPRNLSASISLVDVYRESGKLEQALALARDIWAADPDDVLHGLDVAELSHALGELDDAAAAYEQLLERDDERHDAYLRWGQLELALAREAWSEGAELAAEAARRDPSARAQKLLTYFADRTFGSLDRSATSPGVSAALVASQSGIFALPAMTGPPVVPARAEVEQLLAEARAEHRRIHVEAAGE